METGLQAFLSLLAAILIGHVTIWCLYQVWVFHQTARGLRNQKTAERAALDLRLTWLCFVTRYARLLPEPWSRTWSIRAAKDLEPWIGRDTSPFVVVRSDPTSPTGRRYRAVCDG